MTHLLEESLGEESHQWREQSQCQNTDGENRMLETSPTYHQMQPVVMPQTPRTSYSQQASLAPPPQKRQINYDCLAPRAPSLTLLLKEAETNSRRFMSYASKATTFDIATELEKLSLSDVSKTPILSVIVVQQSFVMRTLLQDVAILKQQRSAAERVVVPDRYHVSPSTASLSFARQWIPIKEYPDLKLRETHILMVLKITPAMVIHGRSSKPMKFDRRLSLLCDNLFRMLLRKREEWSLVALEDRPDCSIFPRNLLNSIIPIVCDIVSPINEDEMLDDDLMFSTIRKKCLEALTRTRRAVKRKSADDSAASVDVSSQTINHRALVAFNDNEYELHYSAFAKSHCSQMAASASGADARTLLSRSMDRLRRSIRKSLGRRKSPERPLGELVGSTSGGRAEVWHPADDSAVRAGMCSFAVKYLGSVEVFESRGMQVCEGALKLLRAQRRRPVKAVLYVSGDGLRVVDQENNRGLLVDQTIEKVSFCAPDRNNDRGFAYICRDGATRRWMCHGFHAAKESGERLSHAVGCAFAVCLERKKKRDEESAQHVKKLAEKALNPTWDDQPSSSKTAEPVPVVSEPTTSASGSGMERVNPAYQSFRRQLTISERLRDPQSAILTEQLSTQERNVPAMIAKPRPTPNPLLFQRQGSLRAPDPAPNSFRRQLSLRPQPTSNNFDLASLKVGGGISLYNEPIYEGDEDTGKQGFAAPDPSTMPDGVSVAQFTASHHGGISTQSFNNGFNNGTAPSSSFSVLENQAPDSNATETWTDLPDSPPGNNKSKADDWLENALRKVTISPPLQPATTNTLSGGCTNYGSHYAAPPGAGAGATNSDSPSMTSSVSVDSSLLSTAPKIAPPAIPARPAKSSLAGLAMGTVVAVNSTASSEDWPSEPATATRVNGSSQIIQLHDTQRWDSPVSNVNWERTAEKHQVQVPEDPFDVQWSKMALNNPMNMESTPVNI